MAISEQDFTTKLAVVAADIETISTDIARVIALRNQNSDTRSVLTQRLEVIKARLEQIAPSPEVTTNVVALVQPAE